MPKVYLTTSHTAYRMYEVEIPDDVDVNDSDAVYGSVAAADKKQLTEYDDVDVDEESVDIREGPPNASGRKLWSEEEAALSTWQNSNAKV